jgi:hypothetical protein
MTCCYEVDHVRKGADCGTCAKRLIARKLQGTSPLNIVHVNPKRDLRQAPRPVTYIKLILFIKVF